MGEREERPPRLLPREEQRRRPGQQAEGDYPGQAEPAAGEA
ncbi:MAG: hypothetical protein O2798_05035 [Chloroflexi bacterium]|nr:hypothetical protein [Chloroflexota bacterium]MDA1240192.1 hypothetical protein [Chloroflexota bacterium]